jgi:hypothetical protein
VSSSVMSQFKKLLNAVPSGEYFLININATKLTQRFLKL